MSATIDVLCGYCGKELETEEKIKVGTFQILVVPCTECEEELKQEIRKEVERELKP